MRMTIEKRPKVGESVTHVGTGNTKHKGPEVAVDLAYSCVFQEARVTGLRGGQAE